MVAKLVIDRKREGHALSGSEIRSFVEGFTSGEIPDYQMSALAMAICCRGMNGRETADLTEAMKNSGVCLEWDFPTADKHSTGGVGDKLSLVVQPLAAACSIAVPSLTGRGLGITGGTADKLETIPGYDASLSISGFRKVVEETGVSMTVQTDEITPADKKLYRLRDVTGTVASIPLITASILSKKLAEGAQTLVFDVKCGKGAFMKTLEEARSLARSLVDGARAAGRNAVALVTDMNEPLGSVVGNAREVEEAIAMLSPGAASNPVLELCIELSSLMVSLAKGIPEEDAQRECREKLAGGEALEKFKAMVKAQGGNLDRFAELLRRPTFRFTLQAMKSGYISCVDAERVGRVALSLGAGREKAGDGIDPLAGVTLLVSRGSRVSVGTPLATLEKSSGPDDMEKAAADLLKAFSIVPEKPELSDSLVLERIS